MFQRVEDLFCQSLRNTRHFCNFFDTCVTKALQTSHIFQQHLATLWPDTFDGLKRAGAFHFRPLFTMPANRMIVRFIADMLDNVQCRRIRRQASPHLPAQRTAFPGLLYDRPLLPPPARVGAVCPREHPAQQKRLSPALTDLYRRRSI